MDYSIYKMVELNGIVPGEQLDALIIQNTIEDRAWSSVDYFQKMNNLPAKVLVLDYKDRQLSRYDDKYVGTSFDSIELDDDYSVPSIRLLRHIDAFIGDAETIGIDISVIPIPLFYQILNFIIKRKKIKTIVVLYTEPQYYTLENLFEYENLIGEISFKAIPGFEGKTAKINEQKHVIFFILGFEKEFISRLIPVEINSEVIIPINGFPSFSPKYKDISLINNNVNYHEIDIPIIYASANNPFELYNQLLSLKEKYTEYCIDIIPVGSKPMALGSCLFSLKNADSGVRILYPFPSRFCEDNSKGKGRIWEYYLYPY